MKPASIGCKGMAKWQKQHNPLSKEGIHEVTLPNALAPLMQAFHADSNKKAKELILEALSIIYAVDNGERRVAISQTEVEGILSFMKAINPGDTLETLYAAQIVFSHTLGMRGLVSNYSDDKRLGMNLLRFSNEVMALLEKKRRHGSPNINVIRAY